MQTQTLNIFLIFFAGLILGACEKDNLSADGLVVDRLIVYQEEVIYRAFDVVTIGDEALCVYYAGAEFPNGEYRMKLINADGETLWTKPIGHGIGESIDLVPQFLEKVIVDKSDNTFAIFFGNQLLKINRLGEAVYYNPSFFNLDYYKMFDIFQDSDYNFIVSGTKNARAFMAKYSPDGQELFRNIYFVALPGVNAFTSAVELPNGGYLFAGTKEAASEDQANTMIIAKVDDFGEIEWTKLNELTGEHYLENAQVGGNVFGREFLALDNGNFIYVLNASHFGDPNQIVTIYSIDPLGNIIDSRHVSHAVNNFAVGPAQNLLASLAQRNVGRGLIKSPSGGYYGLVNQINQEIDFATFDDLVQLGGEVGYTYALDADGDVLSMDYFDNRTVHNFQSINQFANGKKIALGVNRSFGESARIVLTIF